MKVLSSLWVAVCLLSVYREVRGAVISIDFGAEWIKIALVKPGVPMEIVLNKESKRKSSAVVAMRNGERTFGNEALVTAVKYPKNAYQYVQFLVGQKYDSPLVEQYRKWFPYYDIRKDEERGTVLFQHDSETVFSPEELIGMMFNYSRQLAQEYGGQAVRDVVLTVPSFFNQAQRRVLLHAAELVDLNVLQLMTDGAAAALNYGVFRQASFNATPQYIMLYDMGAVSTTATIVEYRTAQLREGAVVNTYPQLSVKGTGFDRTLGGLDMDIRLRDMLAKNFESLKKTQGSVYDSPRAMAKLLKEAKKLKQVLSANSKHFVQVEGLLEDVDFKLKVTREEFEELCSDLFTRVGEPVKRALLAADMTLGEIETVILLGGGTRVPKIQELLLDVVDRAELGRNLNTDEAPALGAVYQAAGRSKLFRVKKFIVKDANIYPVQVSFTRTTVGEDGTEVDKIITRTLFKRSNAYPQKKVLTFNRYSNDFAFAVFYGDLEFLSDQERSYLGRLNLTEVYLAGVSDSLSSHSGAEAKGVKAHFRMDDSGLLTLDYVESIFEYPVVEEESTFSKISNTLSNLFGGGSSFTEGEEEGGNRESEETATKEVGGKEEESLGPESGTGNVGATGGEGEEPGDAEGGQEDGVEDEDEASTTEQDEEGSGREGSPEQDTRPSAGDTRPTDEDTRPTDEDTRPTAEETSSSEEDSSSSEEDSSSSEEDTRPTEEDTRPTEEGTRPSEEDSRPGEDTEPTEGDAGPTEGDTGPTEEDTRPTEGDAGPTEGDAGPTEGDAGPTEEVKKVEKSEPKGRVVKVNLTAEVTTLDLSPLTDTQSKKSMQKLHELQQRDEERLANEHARNDLESHIFEFIDIMHSDYVIAVSTEEQREAILASLREASDWLEEDGYAAETKEYKDRLRSLKRVSRSLVRRVTEAAKRPKLVAALTGSVNLSRQFLSQMKNLSAEVQVFSEVEMTTLETLVNETEAWLYKMIAEQLATPPHEEPVLMSHEIEEQTRKVDREVMYLLNKLRTHPPPKPKTPFNATKNGTSNGTNPTLNEAAGEGESEGVKEEEETVLPDTDNVEITPDSEAEPMTPIEPLPPTFPDSSPSPSSSEEHQEL